MTRVVQHHPCHGWHGSFGTSAYSHCVLLGLLRENHSLRHQLPAGLVATLFERRGHSLANGFAHARHAEQKQRLLNGVPIFFGNQHGVGARARDQNRLMIARGLIEQAIKLFPRVAGRAG